MTYFQAFLYGCAIVLFALQSAQFEKEIKRDIPDCPAWARTLAGWGIGLFCLAMGAAFGAVMWAADHFLPLLFAK